MTVWLLYTMTIIDAMCLMQEPLLRALQYLPHIVQLQKVLVACLNHKIDRGEADSLTIRMCFDKIANSGTGTVYARMCTWYMVYAT